MKPISLWKIWTPYPNSFWCSLSPLNRSPCVTSHPVYRFIQRKSYNSYIWSPSRKIDDTFFNVTARFIYGCNWKNYTIKGWLSMFFFYELAYNVTSISWILEFYFWILFYCLLCDFSWKSPEILTVVCFRTWLIFCWYFFMFWY